MSNSGTLSHALLITFLCVALHLQKPLAGCDANAWVAHRERQAATVHNLPQKQPNGITQLQVIGLQNGHGLGLELYIDSGTDDAVFRDSSW